MSKLLAPLATATELLGPHSGRLRLWYSEASNEFQCLDPTHQPKMLSLGDSVNAWTSISDSCVAKSSTEAYSRKHLSFVGLNDVVQSLRDIRGSHGSTTQTILRAAQMNPFWWSVDQHSSFYCRSTRIIVRKNSVSCIHSPNPPILKDSERLVKHNSSDVTNEVFMKLRLHEKYLREVSSMGELSPITPETALVARRAWRAILEASRFRMPVPAACTGPDGQMFYSWDRDRHHLELEITADRPSEFFYRDRETDELWGEDYNIGEPVSDEAVQKIGLFI